MKIVARKKKKGLVLQRAWYLDTALPDVQSSARDDVNNH